MKTKIRPDGTLLIAAETELEQYALDQWSKENIRYDDVRAPHPRISVYFGDSLVRGSSTFDELAETLSKP
ncbi:hypothetical protein G3N59_01225 [Paraburkholderia sp. Ac-20340]|uniref:hypothetical protein n=1 Tax=Paraburkholderia sp. Ac-20340 TaxID=2703888 RepID=UPI00197F589C|nr:hypothetical protein [Paraburkholderia sp. Ac-20340]MBN3851989.1 hypothetical protein [Paraburkholderia sp. Ac-20340]